MAMACGSGGGRAGNGDGAFEASDEATDHADAAHEDGQRDAGDVGPGDTAFDATVEVGGDTAANDEDFLELHMDAAVPDLTKADEGGDDAAGLLADADVETGDTGDAEGAAADGTFDSGEADHSAGEVCDDLQIPDADTYSDASDACAEASDSSDELNDAGACENAICPDESDSTNDPGQENPCVTGPPDQCDDHDPCTADNCDPANGCIHAPQACCSDGVVDPGEECDDLNLVDGDGCDSTCLIDCPAGAVLEAGYCWVRAITATETHSQACARILRFATPPEVVLTWDDAALTRVANGLGFTSAGDDGDFAPAMWCDETAGTCDTHAFGTAFYNYGARVPAPDARPVYTCAAGNQSELPLPPLTVHFIDVGQGDGIMLDVGGTEVLIDGGDAGAQTATYIQPFVDGPIDVVVVTHPHTDHYRGLIDVLNRYAVKEIWLNGATATGTTWAEFTTAVRAQETAGAKVRILTRNNTATAGILGFTIMNPGTVLTNDVNGDSLVMRMAHGDVAFDFTGDTITSEETKILAAGYTPRAQILKLAHHGSSTSNSQKWLNAVLPEVAIYSAALGNSYGHPSASVVSSILAMGITLLGTDTRGTILVETGGLNYSVTTQK
jgi:cysteine-rich repeat protein